MSSEASQTPRCGMVAVVGAPNAGKSTLVNALVGQKVAIVSPKAQTTRTRLMGVAIAGDAQIVLVDTPGIFEAKRRFDRAMVQAAWGGAADADVIALVVDAKAGVGGGRLEAILSGLATRPEPKILILNKVDVADKERLLRHAATLNARLGFEDTYMISAVTGLGVDDVKVRLATACPAGPWHFPADQVSDATDRVLAAEVTREQIFLQLYQELPQACAVETEQYKESAGSVEIHQQILVARDSQRAIVLGKGGARLKAIGSAARTELAALLGVKVHLYLHVKVAPKWDEDRGVYRDIGLDWVE